ncbi:hypothetical protein DYH09_33200 [bacterium CPR1]|nr:hypothetical protein [bacterium CPR1]
MVFRYRVLDAASKSKDGFIEAESEDLARRGLELQGYFVTELGEADSGTLEELARQKAAEERSRRLEELAAQPRKRGSPVPLLVFLTFLAIGGWFGYEKWGTPVRLPDPNVPTPTEARQYKVVVSGRVDKPVDRFTNVAFSFPEVPVQFEQRLLDFGQDGKFRTELTFFSYKEPTKMVLKVTRGDYDERQLEQPLEGSPLSATFPPVTLDKIRK